METMHGPSSILQDGPIGTAPDGNENDEGSESEERREEVYEATIISLDPEAAHLLFQLADT